MSFGLPAEPMPSAVEKPKLVLSDATRILFTIAANSHTLRDIFGIGRGEVNDKILPIVRPWLQPHPVRTNEFSFDPDLFKKYTRSLSDGETFMVLWILNVWNPSYARSKKWNFNLFDALGTLDNGNRLAICDWLKQPIWP